VVCVYLEFTIEELFSKRGAGILRR
jgi:hypothetical protein